MISGTLSMMVYLLRLALSQTLLHQLNALGDLEMGRDFVRHSNVGCSVPRSGSKTLLNSPTYQVRARGLSTCFATFLAHNHRYICILLPERMLSFEQSVAGAV